MRAGVASPNGPRVSASDAETAAYRAKLDSDKFGDEVAWKVQTGGFTEPCTRLTSPPGYATGQKTSRNIKTESDANVTSFWPSCRFQGWKFNLNPHYRQKDRSSCPRFLFLPHSCPLYPFSLHLTSLSSCSQIHLKKNKPKVRVERARVETQGGWIQFFVSGPLLTPYREFVSYSECLCRTQRPRKPPNRYQGYLQWKCQLNPFST